MTLQEVKRAQTRYIENLSSFIPEGVKYILDVGCGIGGNTEFLMNSGYELEALSPDDFQKSVIKEKFASKKDVIKAIRKLGLALQMESYIIKTNNQHNITNHSYKTFLQLKHML